MPVTPEGETVEARFVERPNRFVIVADTDEGTVRAHCPNPGRLGEFLHEGTPYLLRRRPDATPEQTTTHSVVAAVDGRFHVGTDMALGQAPPPEERSFDDGAWVVLDTQMANALVDEALARGRLEDAFPGRRSHTREPPAHEGRFDFRVETQDEPWIIEVKSVTLVGSDGRTALFPDAPTERGTRHVRELAERAREGERNVVILLAMRGDAERVAPNAPMDPAFAQALAEADEAGVRLLGRRIRRVGEGFEVGEGIEVALEPGPAATGVTPEGEPVDANPASREGL